MSDFKTKRNVMVIPSRYKETDEARAKFTKISDVLQKADNQSTFVFVIPIMHYFEKDAQGNVLYDEKGPVYVKCVCADTRLSYDCNSNFRKIIYNSDMYYENEDGSIEDTSPIVSYRKVTDLIRLTKRDKEIATIQQNEPEGPAKQEKINKIRASYTWDDFNAYAKAKFPTETDEAARKAARDIVKDQPYYVKPPRKIIATMALMIPASADKKIDTEKFTPDKAIQVYIKLNPYLRTVLEQACIDQGTDKGYITVAGTWNANNGSLGLNMSAFYKNVMQHKDIGLSGYSSGEFKKPPINPDIWNKTLEKLIRDPNVVYNKISEFRGMNLEDGIRNIQQFLQDNENALTAVDTESNDFKIAAKHIINISDILSRLNSTPFMNKARELASDASANQASNQAVRNEQQREQAESDANVADFGIGGFGNFPQSPQPLNTPQQAANGFTNVTQPQAPVQPAQPQAPVQPAPQATFAQPAPAQAAPAQAAPAQAAPVFNQSMFQI